MHAASRVARVTPFGIYGFFGEYRFLSNFEAAPLRLEGEWADGLVYPTSEHAYMALKTEDLDIRRRISLLEKGRDAKAFGRTVSLREGWDGPLRLEAMLAALRAKFRQNPELAAKLLATGLLYLEETNDWRDVFWGVCQGKGLNMLGKMLMQVRAELQENLGLLDNQQVSLL